MESEHSPQTNCHVGIPGEIVINLERIRQRAQPRHCNRQLASGKFERRVRDNAHRVGNQHLFSQTNDEPANAVGEIVKRRLAFMNLVSDGFVTNNRAGNQLWEKRNVQSHVERVLLRLTFAAIDVDNVGNRLKRKERNPDRQHDFWNRNVAASKVIDVPQNKHPVLEIGENAQVDA